MRLFSLVLVLVFVGSVASAKDGTIALFCSDNASNGFTKNGEATRWTRERFSAVFTDKSYRTLKIANKTFLCSVESYVGVTTVECNHLKGASFFFNPSNGRYIWMTASSYGWLSVQKDPTASTRIGTCTTF